ncbi:MAG: hypothetical protein RMJ28_06920 [Nitrososphaerota archaeon]|nr:hypothetical protein [Candidatus Calditenuaceae archaeon]MDW8073945.1 hypothetical protein [Nitrososphaerota archaeon]
MGLAYRLGLLAAVVVLVVAGVALVADWPVGLGDYSVEVCREVLEDGARIVCEERRFSVLRGSPVSGVLGVALLFLALALIVVLVREYFVRSFEYLAKRIRGL